MSLFVAIRPSAAARDDLSDAIDRVRKPLENIRLHWHPPDRWHVTVAFLGDPSVDADDAAAECLASIDAPAVQVRLAGSGCFGRQVLWVGVEGDAAFTDLGSMVQTRLRSAGLRLDKRPWHPHLTVARTRGTDARPAAAYLAEYRGPAWSVSELLLVRSEGGPHPRHIVVFSSPVVGPGA